MLLPQLAYFKVVVINVKEPNQRKRPLLFAQSL